MKMGTMLEHFSNLDSDLAVGSYPHAPEHVGFLKGEGVSSVINLQSDRDLGALGVVWPIMWQFYVREGVQVTRVPVIDFDRKDLLRYLDDAVAAIAASVDAGRKTYVHCSAGMNRSPTSIIAYLAAHREMPMSDAIAWMSERHRCIPYPDVLEGWAKRRGLSLS
jgi:protein-tyrosine phosphatase